MMRTSFFALAALPLALLACSAEDESTSNASADVVSGKACTSKKPSSPPICTADYNPVCGCDGKTYGNACEAGAYVSSWTDEACGGEASAVCKAKPSKETIYCPEVFLPVCGCDGKTYGNACDAGRSVTTWTDGECGAAAACKAKPSTETTYCPEVFLPVCGCDGKTYGNACDAGRSVTSWSDGECGAAACKAKPSTETTYCPEVFLPVCGCDGKTYGNSCDAARSVTTWTDGECQ